MICELHRPWLDDDEKNSPSRGMPASAHNLGPALLLTTLHSRCLLWSQCSLTQQEGNSLSDLRRMSTKYNYYVVVGTCHHNLSHNFKIGTDVPWRSLRYI